MLHGSGVLFTMSTSQKNPPDPCREFVLKAIRTTPADQLYSGKSRRSLGGPADLRSEIRPSPIDHLHLGKSGEGLVDPAEPCREFVLREIGTNFVENLPLVKEGRPLPIICNQGNPVKTCLN